MADAEVIKIGTAGKGRREERAGEQVARAASRARGSQRRSSGLVPSEPVDPRADAAGAPASAAPPAATDAPATDASAAPAGGAVRPEPVAEPHPGPSVPAGWALEKVASGLVDSARRIAGSEWERTLASALAFLRRRITGEYEVDEFGFDPHLNDAVFMAVLRPLYRAWFRVEVRGIENVPAKGGALLVANHSGTIALDSLMTQLALLDEHPARRHLRMLGADLVFSTPFVSELARKGGTTLACQADAERLLRAGELVGVWPEGFKGIGKPYTERYKLQRFGRGGFVSAALRTGTPLVPVSIVGAEEIYPIIGQMGTLARVLGLPYAPVTPTWPWLGPLGLIPLPSKWIIEFGEPLATDGLGSHAAEDPMLVFDLTDQVRERIQQTLYSLLMQRRSVFF